MTAPLLAVGFDLDYTLWDQDAFALSLFEDLAQEWGVRLACGPEAVRQAFTGAMDRLTLAHPKLFDEALRDLGAWSPAGVAELVRRYRQHRPPVQLYPGAAELLDRLAGRGLRLFLVTDGHSATQRHKVEALGMGNRFHCQVFTGDYPEAFSKPSVLPFLLACGNLGVDPSGCVYVGDNPRCDVQGPRQLGMRTVGVATGPFAHLEAAPEQVAHLRIGQVRDLEEVL